MEGIIKTAGKWFRRMKYWWDNYPLLASFFVCLIFFSFFSFFYFSIPEPIKVGDFDRFFHFKFAELIKEKGVDAIKNFDWIKLSNFKQEGGFQVALYHIALIPFTLLKNPIVGSKISDILWAALSMGMIYYVFRKTKVPAPFIFSLIIVSSPFLLFRFLLGRNLVMVFGFIILEIYLSARKEYTALFWVFIFHVLWHTSTFFLPMMVPIIVEMIRNVQGEKIVKKGIIIGLLAPFIAMALTPNFPNNVEQLPKIIFGIHEKLSSENIFIMTEGSELVTKTLSNIMDSASLILLIFIVGSGLTIYYYLEMKRGSAQKEGEEKETDLLLYSTFVASVFFLFGLFFFSGRFMDYFLVCSVFLGALVLKKTWKEREISISGKAGKAVAFSLIIFFFLALYNPMKSAVLNPQELGPYQEAAEWLEDRSNEGDLVFLDSWSQFPTFFFFNDKNRYSMGMEPMYLMEYSPELYWKWHNINLNTFYCNKERDCRKDKESIISLLESDKEKKEIFAKENSKKIIDSIRHDFGAKFIASSNNQLNYSLSLNKDLLENYKNIEMSSGGMLQVTQLKE